MTALSTLWGIDEESLDTLIQARGASARCVPTECSSCETSRITLLGDRMLAGNCATATHVVAVAASPQRVWPWLAQMMRGAGMYGWEALETPACRSAEHLVSGLAVPRLGDQVDECLILAALTPGEEIVWAALEPVRLLDCELSGLTVNYAVHPITDGNGDSRLIARLRFTSPGMTAQAAATLRKALELLLIGSQLARLRAIIHDFEQRTEDGRSVSARSGRHQAAPLKPALVANLLARKH